MTGSVQSITIKKFCYGGALSSADSVGYHYDMTSLPTGLAFNWATSILKGTPTITGTFELKSYKLVAGSISSATFLVTILDGTLPTLTSTDFYIDPTQVLIMYPFEYTFIPTDFFTIVTGSTYTLSAKLQDQTTLVTSSLPSWLTFYPSNYTFYGIPTDNDYTYPTDTFPLYLNIVLEATVVSGTLTTKAATLTIKNTDTYIDTNYQYPTKMCKKRNEYFYN